MPPDAPARSGTAFLFDVDDTLLDNDAIAADLDRHLVATLGAGPAKEYWTHFEQLRAETGYADYLGAAQALRRGHPAEPAVFEIGRFLLDYPFASRLYPQALAAVAAAARLGPVGILSDGDAVFQPRKIARAGLAAAVDGRVIVCIHKERELDLVRARLPAERYVVVDDKWRLLAAIKSAWGDAVTTVFVRQGHYAHDPAERRDRPAPDLELDAIAALREVPPARFGITAPP
jgi:FMN phosphatase YigB (HAD superfamily)